MRRVAKWGSAAGHAASRRLSARGLTSPLAEMSRRGEEMEFLAGAGAGDVEEALALSGFAAPVDAFEPTCESVDLFALGCDGREHDVSGVGHRMNRAGRFPTR